MPNGDSTLSWCDSTADIPVAEWDGLAGPDELFLSHRWLRVVEETAATPMRYLCARRGGQPVAALATAMATADVPWVSGRVDHVLTECAEAGSSGAAAFLHAVGGADALLPNVHCGGRHIGRNRVLHTGDRGDVATLVEAAEKLAADNGSASVSFSYVDERDTVLTGVLRDRGYFSFAAGSYHWLDVDPGGFGPYLAALPRKRRFSVHSERRKVSEAGLTITHERVTPEIVGRLAELDVLLLAKYGLTWPVERSAEAIGTSAARFADDASVLLCRADGEIRGFALMLRQGNHWYARQCGFDYDFLGKLPVYYELLYYSAVERAAEIGVTTIQYGLGSDTAKRSRGCQWSELTAHVLPLRRCA
ncbi:putative N-acyltransferase [Actinokineospora baliensis]|uniref:GNAT family N-acetyltransferase n=1 Tax=Actinokineospora baliensis TaxID=547056 RepID=UPI0019578A68|nr:GNAT family N-acetyltransferase [Actinokineospora baliensis]MBM7773961.1 putative N-acyltransferase [Actinokineospora baliensis]